MENEGRVLVYERAGAQQKTRAFAMFLCVRVRSRSGFSLPCAQTCTHATHRTKAKACPNAPRGAQPILDRPGLHVCAQDSFRGVRGRADGRPDVRTGARVGRRAGGSAGARSRAGGARAGWTGGSARAQAGRRASGRAEGRTDGRTRGWVDGRTDIGTDGRTDECADG